MNDQGSGIPPDDAPESIARREALAALAAIAASFAASSAGAATLLQGQQLPGGVLQQQMQIMPPRTDADVAAHAVLDGMRAAVAMWTTRTHFRDIVVNAIVATGGRLDGPPLGGLFAIPAQSASVQPLIPAFVNATSTAWGRWAASVKVPGLPWYPAFAAFPGPMAPPMPNVPTPLIATLFDPSPLLPQNLAAQIRAGMGARANEAGAADAVDHYTRELAAKFYIWLSACQVMLVMGRGSIPTFAPPYVPVGPVIMGVAEGGSLTASWP